MWSLSAFGSFVALVVRCWFLLIDLFFSQFGHFEPGSMIAVLLLCVIINWFLALHFSSRFFFIDMHFNFKQCRYFRRKRKKGMQLFGWLFEISKIRSKIYCNKIRMQYYWVFLYVRAIKAIKRNAFKCGRMWIEPSTKSFEYENRKLSRQTENYCP